MEPVRTIFWVNNRVASLIVSVALGALPVSASADAVTPSLSLPELLAEAQRANPTLREARTRWQAAQARIPQAKGLPAPRIGIEFEEIPKGTVKLNQATIMYQLIQSLPFPGKLSLKHRVAIKDAQLAAMAFKQAEWNIASQMKEAYYELFLLDRELALQQEQRWWIEQAVATAQAQYATGQADQAELLGWQAEALQASNELEVLTHRRRAMAAHLNHLLNRPVHDAVGQPQPMTLQALPATADELVLAATERQPELLMFRYSAERAEASWRLAKRELWPDLETMAELRDPAMGPIGPWDLSLAIALPFWFWTKAKYGVKAALFDKESAQAAYEATRNEIARRIHEHWHEAQAAYQTARLCEDGLLTLRRQAVSSAMAAYQSGRGSGMALAQALQQDAQQRRTYAQHLVAFEQHVVMLEEASGVPLRASHDVSLTEVASEPARATP